MRSTEFASLGKNLEFLCRKWHFLILFSLFSGPRRFNEIKRVIDNNISSKSLSLGLKSLKAKGFVEMRLYGRRSKKAYYQLTPKGKLLGDVYREMLRWNRLQKKRTKESTPARIRA